MAPAWVESGAGEVRKKPLALRAGVVTGWGWGGQPRSAASGWGSRCEQPEAPCRAGPASPSPLGLISSCSGHHPSPPPLLHLPCPEGPNKGHATATVPTAPCPAPALHTAPCPPLLDTPTHNQTGPGLQGSWLPSPFTSQPQTPGFSSLHPGLKTPEASDCIWGPLPCQGERALPLLPHPPSPGLWALAALQALAPRPELHCCRCRVVEELLGRWTDEGRRSRSGRLHPPGLRLTRLPRMHFPLSRDGKHPTDALQAAALHATRPCLPL